MGIKRALLYLRTARYLGWKQVALRLGYVSERLSFRLVPKVPELLYKPAHAPSLSGQAYHLLPGCSLRPSFLNSPNDRWLRVSSDRAWRAINRGLRFLNETVNFPDRIDWTGSGSGRLWRYHLHGFDWGLDLALASHMDLGVRAYEAFRDYVGDWTQNAKPYTGVGWDSYPLSVRLANWVLAASIFAERLLQDLEFADLFWRQVYTQASFLNGHVEYDIRGNHLIKNGRALFYAGLCFQGARAGAWVERGLRILDEALQEQILPDGGHYERSPMYQCAVLQDYLEVLGIARAHGRGVLHLMEERIRSMAIWLKEMRHPDEDIPLFQDSSLGTYLLPNELLCWTAAALGDASLKTPNGQLPVIAQLFLAPKDVDRFGTTPEWSRTLVRRTTSLPYSGYYVITSQGGRDVLFADAGSLGPRCVPGHAHAASLGFELSLDAGRAIVDSGVEGYRNDGWRAYCRGTQAHNTLAIDGHDQAELWHVFRVGRRGGTRVLCWFSEPGLTLLDAENDGFNRLSPGLFHRRRFALVDDRFWLIVDLVGGTGKHRIESYIHIHPDWTIGPHTDGTVHSSLPGGPEELWIVPYGHQEACILNKEDARGPEDPTWYCPEFGRRVPAPTIILTSRTPLPFVFGYVLARERPTIHATPLHHAELSLEVRFVDRSYLLASDELEMRVESCQSIS